MIQNKTRVIPGPLKIQCVQLRHFSISLFRGLRRIDSFPTSQLSHISQIAIWKRFLSEMLVWSINRCSRW